jgi:glycosyltransferase involved in cell wall biosynthesis
MNKIFVAHIRDSGGIFGAERVILTIGKNIDKKFKVILICLKSPDGKSDILKKKAEEIGVDVISVDVNSKIDFSSVKHIRDILKNHQVKILHSHDFKSNLYGVMASKNLGIKRILTAGGTTRDSMLKKLYVYMDETFTYKYYDYIVAVSREIYDKLVKKNINQEKVVVVENGIDESLYDYDTDRENNITPFPIDNTNKVFAVIGRLFPDKAHRYFIEAFSDIKKAYPRSVALIIGEGPSEEEIRRQIIDLKLEDSVFLCGVRKDMIYVYRNIDYLVLPSLTEGLPYVLLEAMLFKVPVLATDVGGIPNLIINSVTGYLVPPGDVESLKNGMENMLNDPEKVRDMSEEGYKLVKEKYSARRMAENYGRLYDSMINSHPLQHA